MKVNVKIKNKSGATMQEQLVDTDVFQERINEIDRLLEVDYENDVRYQKLTERQKKIFPMIIKTLKKEKFERKRWINRVNYFKEKKNGN